MIIVSLIYFKFFSNELLIQPFGYSILIVSSRSMEPQIKKRNFILIKKCSKYEIGEIVTFSIDKSNLITHRIVEKCENEFITKGDKNNVYDEESINIDEIYGKVIFIF